MNLPRVTRSLKGNSDVREVFIGVRVPDEVNMNDVRMWCAQNCKNAFYTGTDWNLSLWTVNGKNQLVEFVDAKDAALFALRWS